MMSLNKDESVDSMTDDSSCLDSVDSEAENE